MIFATYSSLIGESQATGKYKTRFKQLLKWFGKDFDGVVSFMYGKKLPMEYKVTGLNFFVIVLLIHLG